MDQNEMSKLYRGPSIDASNQVSAHLAKRFQIRRFLEIDQSEQELPVATMLVNIICMLMFHHIGLSFSIKSLRNNLC
jgi:hypothetical protein